MARDNFLEAKHLSMKYGKRNALRDVTFSVNEGSITGVIGANGCGKTTLFKIIGGLIQDYEGEVCICGCRDTWKTKRDVCYHPTLPFYQPKMTIRKAIRQHALLHGGFDENAALRMFEQFDYDVSAYLGQLSRGRCALALLILSLATDARIYLFDEPFGGIDIKSRAQMKEIMADASYEGKTLLIATHEIYDFEPLFDDVMLFREGNLILKSSADDLRKQYGDSVVEIAKEMI